MSEKDHPGGEVWNAVLAFMTWADPTERVKRLYRHEALRDRADKLQARLTAAAIPGADARLLHDIVQAELHAERMDNAAVVSAHANLGGPGKTRAKRAPHVTEWIAADVARHRDHTWKERWKRAPANVREIGPDGFRQRVSRAIAPAKK